MPKQYLNLMGQPIAMHSLKTFGHMPEVGEIVVVCDPSYRCRPADSPPVCLSLANVPAQLSHSTYCSIDETVVTNMQGPLPGALESAAQYCEA